MSVTETEDELAAGDNGPADPARDPMAELRPDTPADVELARARMLGDLFGHDHNTAFGRFHVIARLGKGGMGVVYEAYDPRLARGVALKLVRVAATERERALAEAKALARLSHPNVVPIYDADLEGDHVYLVMELIRGKTLREWAPGRTPAEVLETYRQAGLALAAAHAAGLVHRDFKPDNALVGTDGRVRVVDFGLACEADGPAGASSAPRPAAGTPRFMAPELRAAGAAITPAADQYSFCVALGDALAATGAPVPRRIEAVIERGRAADPARRFPSMIELLRALARDPARTWRRATLAGALAVLLAGGAFVAGRHSPNQVDLCGDGAARLAAAWPPAARAAALSRLAGLGADGGSLRAVLERNLDAHATQWTRQYRAACAARHARSESDTLSDRRTTCLNRGIDALAAVGELVSRARRDNLAELPLAVQALPAPSACGDRDALLSDVAPPPPQLVPAIAVLRRRITQARVELGAGRYEQAGLAAAPVVEQARLLGYRPLLAEALLVAGHARSMLPDRGEAAPILAEATAAAMAAGDDALAVEAWARRAYALGTSRAPDAGLAGLDVIEALALRTPGATFARALLYNNAGSVELARERRADARGHFERALDASRSDPSGALELVAIQANLALVSDDRAYGDRLLVDAVDRLTARLGPSHPHTLEVQRLRGIATLEDLSGASAVLAITCAALDTYTTLGGRAADCWNEVGLIQWELGERAGAIGAFERMARQPARATDAERQLALLRGDARAAARLFAAAVAARPARDGERWWDRLTRAELRLGLGRAHRALGDLRAARAALEPAVADLDAIVRAHPATSFERRLGRARVELALTMAALGIPSDATTPALRWLERTGGPRGERAALHAALE